MKQRLTNKYNLPRPIVEAIMNDPYNSDKSDYTITGLLKPPRESAICKSQRVIGDVSERLDALQGQVMHGILERAGKTLGEEGFVVEKRFKTTYAVDGRIYTVSAQIDLFDPVTATVSDYKDTLVSSSRYGLKEDHKLQVSFQAEVIRRAGFQVSSGEIVLILRDWAPLRVYGDYPTSPFIKVSVPLLTSNEVNKWVEERIRAHEAAKVLLPRCTDEERYSRPTFAVMKSVTAKRASRVFDTREEAAAFITAKAPSEEVVERPGVSIRCLYYCPARTVCEQAKEYREETPAIEEGFTKV